MIAFRIVRRLALCAVAACMTARADAQQVESMRFSTDVGFGIGAAPAQLAEPSSLIDFTAGEGLEVVLSLASPNAAANLDGLHELANGARLLSYDIAVPIAGGEIAHPADVILEGPPPEREQDIFFDHTEFGISDAANVDAIAVFDESVLLLSFDSTTVVLPGQPGAVTADDEDLVLFPLDDGAPALAFEGSSLGIPPGAGIDAAEVLPGGVGFSRLAVSFDIGGTIASTPGITGTDFDADDVVFVGDGAWRVVWDGAVNLPGSHAGIDALASVQLTAPTPTETVAGTPVATPTATVTATASATASASVTGTAASTPSASATVTGSAVRTATPPATGTATATRSGTVASATATATTAATAASSATATATTAATAASTATATAMAPVCVGDCNQNGAVSINELIVGVRIALGATAVTECPSLDANRDGTVTINEIIQAVANALSTCP